MNWNHHLKKGSKVNMFSHDHRFNPRVPQPTSFDGVQPSFTKWSEEVIAYLAVTDYQELIPLLMVAAISKDVIETKVIFMGIVQCPVSGLFAVCRVFFVWGAPFQPARLVGQGPFLPPEVLATALADDKRVWHSSKRFPSFLGRVSAQPEDVHLPPIPTNPPPIPHQSPTHPPPIPTNPPPIPHPSPTNPPPIPHQSPHQSPTHPHQPPPIPHPSPPIPHPSPPIPHPSPTNPPPTPDPNPPTTLADSKTKSCQGFGGFWGVGATMPRLSGDGCGKGTVR